MWERVHSQNCLVPAETKRVRRLILSPFIAPDVCIFCCFRPKKIYLRRDQNEKKKKSFFKGHQWFYLFGYIYIYFKLYHWVCNEFCFSFNFGEIIRRLWKLINISKLICWSCGTCHASYWSFNKGFEIIMFEFKYIMAL